jgi:transposase InsO family protein
MLRRHQVPSLKALTEAEKERGVPPSGKGFKDYEPGFIHVDIKYVPKLEGEASRRYLFVAIDRCTRWVFTHIDDDQTEASSTDFLRRLHEACPVKIVKLLTDNGTQFTDRFRKKDRQPSGQHAFDRTCTELEITHRLIPPRTPQMNGMVALDGCTPQGLPARMPEETKRRDQRFNGRISEVLRTHHFESNASLEALLTKYVWMYNHHLPQRALGHVSPIDAMKQWQEKKPELFKRPVSALINKPGLDTPRHPRALSTHVVTNRRLWIAPKPSSNWPKFPLYACVMSYPIVCWKALPALVPPWT